MQTKVREVFRRIGTEMRERWTVVDASGDLETVGASMWDAIADLRRGVEREIEKLWVEKQ
jgi:thymidylate kinase